MKQVFKHLSFVTPELRENNIIVKNINSGLDKSGKVLKHQSRTAEMLNYTFQLMARSIGQMLKNWLAQLNPLTQIKKLFQDFMNYDVKWKRTMNVIHYNLRVIFRTLMTDIAQALVNIIGFIDIISRKIQEALGKIPISLFDQSAANAEKMREELEEVGNATASFDELHDISGETGGASAENDLFGDIYKPQLSQDWIDLAEKIGDLFAGVIKGDLGFGDVMKEILSILWEGLKTIGGYIWNFLKSTIWPLIKDNWLEILGWILAAFIAWRGLKLLGQLLTDALFGGLTKGAVTGLLGKVGGWILSALAATSFGSGIIMGIKGLFNGIGLSTLLAAAKDSTLVSALGGTGATAGAIFAQAFVGVASTALLILSTVFGSKATSELTYYWNTLGTGEKVLGGLKIAAGLAGSALGGAGLGAAIGALGGPLTAAAGAGIGFLIGLLVDVVSWAATSSAGILELADAQEQLRVATDNLNNALANAASAGLNYQNSLSRLNDLEKETGLSGEELAKQVANGELAIEDMTTTQLQVLDAYMRTQTAMEQMKEMQEKLTTASEEHVKASIEEQLSLGKTSECYDDAKAHIIDMWQSSKISSSEARTYLERIMADMDNDTRKTFMENIPNAIKIGLDPNRYASAFRKLADGVKNVFDGILKSAQETWQRVCNLFQGKGFKTNVEVNANGSANVKTATFATGTNYVPNDGLAYLHQGEAVIPKKYNKPYSPEMSANERAYMERMMNTMKSLDNTMKQGIKVNGQFTQRGSDLVAIVNRVNSQTGSNLISDMSYAR